MEYEKKLYNNNITNKAMIVYSARNKVNGKYYVGSTIHTLEFRLRYHCYDAFKKNSQKLFHRALRKYGKRAFEWNVIEYCEDYDEARDLEYHYIKQLKAKLPNGYNMTDGYDNTTLGYKFTEEQRKKCIRFGRLNSNYGNKWTEKQKKEASIRQKENHKHLHGNVNPSKRPDVRKKLSEGKMGMKNPQAKIWILTSPDDNEYLIEGGIKRNLKDFGFTYSMFECKNWEHKGWKLRKG